MSVLGQVEEGWLVVRGVGRRRIISISKTRKMIAKRKKRRENGSRALFLGSKPHSKGLSLSRLGGERDERRRVRERRAKGKAEARASEKSGESMGASCVLLGYLKTTGKSEG